MKETSISSDLRAILDANADLKMGLNAMTEYLYEEYQVKAYFCKILEPRWSFFAGENDIYLTIKRFKITNELGVIIEDNSNDAVYSTIVDGLKTVL